MSDDAKFPNLNLGVDTLLFETTQPSQQKFLIKQQKFEIIFFNSRFKRKRNRMNFKLIKMREEKKANCFFIYRLKMQSYYIYINE